MLFEYVDNPMAKSVVHGWIRGRSRVAEWRIPFNRPPIQEALAGAGGRATYPARLPPRVLGSARRVRWAYAARHSCPPQGQAVPEFREVNVGIVGIPFPTHTHENE